MTTMLTTSPLLQTRSTLEDMLVSLLRKEEPPVRFEMIPPLPGRPNSRARPPTRSLPGASNCKIEIKTRLNKTNNYLTPQENNVHSKQRQPGFPVPYEATSVTTDCSINMISNGLAPRETHIHASQRPPGFPDPYKASSATSYYSINKLPIWCLRTNNQWKSGIAKSISAEESCVTITKDDIVKVANDKIQPANPDFLDLVDDLMLLSYLNEPSVLHTLKRRYSNDMTYTKGGGVLISLNPFRTLKNTENAQLCSMISAAYNDMMRGGRNQSIILSGVSGAGKTEVAKNAVQWICSLRGRNELKNKVKYADLILESFGNAKTIANNNSSTFGKLTKLHFCSEGELCGITVHTFAQEKARVTHLINGERSFHVLYELCYGTSPSMKNKFKLKSADEYSYLTKSECLKIDGVDEAAKLEALMEAFDAMEISREEQCHAFEILSAILWIGNISYEAAKNGSYVNVVEDEAISNCSNLLRCSAVDLITCVSTQNVKVGRESVLKKLTFLEADAKRDALASFLYAGLFRWLVERINKTLCCEKENSSSSIGVLDIYGFRVNKMNTFDTFCINYANERLHQHLLRHLIELPQQEYEFEKVDCIKVDLKDNKECLDLFENKRTGLLSLPGLQPSSLKPTDLKLPDKLNNSCFHCDGGRYFSIQHFGGKVSYDTHGFLKNNLDPFHSDFVDFLSSCENSLLSPFASNDLLDFNSTVSAKLQEELFELVRSLEKTTPHFVLCVAPNDKLLPDLIEDDVVLRQLRQFGIAELLRASRYGFQARLWHHEFSARYGHMAAGSNKHLEPLSICIAVLLRLNIPTSMYHVGYSKVFLRTGTIEILEEKQKLFYKSVRRIQKFFRVSLARRRFQIFKENAILLQSYIRGGIERTRYASLAKKSSNLQTERLRSIVVLQSVIRMWLARRKFKNFVTTSEKNFLDKSKVIVNSSAVGELKRKLTKAVEENALLREQLERYEKRCNDLEAGQIHLSSPSPNMISRLEKEFEDQMVRMENDANGVGDVDELKSLKVKFRSWKKEFKIRLKETKARLRRIGHGDYSRSHRRWWGIGRAHS